MSNSGSALSSGVNSTKVLGQPWVAIRGIESPPELRR